MRDEDGVSFFCGGPVGIVMQSDTPVGDVDHSRNITLS